MGGLCISPTVSNINFHKSWNSFTSTPEALADHVCTSLRPSTGDWGLLICLAHLTPRTGRKHLFVNGTQICTEAGTICTERAPLISNTSRHSAMCHIVHLRAMTQLGWATAWELNREATGMVGTEQSQGRSCRQFDTKSINYTTNIWILCLLCRITTTTRSTHFTQNYTLWNLS